MKKIIRKKKPKKKPRSTLNKYSSYNNPGNFFIVGIGASAGGLEALQHFFDELPPKTGIAYVVIQHLDPTHKSILSEILERHTKMKVVEVSKSTKVMPDSVYVIPPNKDLKIIDGELHLIDPPQRRALRRPIDTFFRSLAEERKDKSIGIILSGTGTEGTPGLKEIKAAGGISLVQEPETAQFDGMPRSAIDAKTADFILSPSEMPGKLLQYVKKEIKLNPSTSQELNVPSINQLKKIFQIIRSRTGYDFSNYKTNTITRRIVKRVALNQFNSIDDYLSFLQNNPEEVENLYKNFLIGVTSFFRDKQVFKSIEKKVIPYLLKNAREKQELRVWVCGCSTGEEAFSLAILFKEALGKTKQYLKVIIFASDIDNNAIEIARSANYPESIISDISPERLTRYFIRKGNGFQLKKEIREMVVFAHHNVIKDPPFSRIDLLTCRNLLIYLNNDLQKKIIPAFHYSLVDGGILLLGTSESIGDNSGLFSEFDRENKIFLKKQNTIPRKSNQDYELPFIQHKPEFPSYLQSAIMKKKINVSALSEKILLDSYAPPSVIIDKNNDAIYFSGNTGLYLEPPNGEARLNILSMTKKGLKSDLELAINKARKNKKDIRVSNIEVKVNSHYHNINLLVKPVLTRDVDLGALMIIFESAPEERTKNESETGTKNKSTKGKRGPNINDLEKELKITREHLQTAINELESSNEDLQSTNEEYQSSNEELQSTNEELETSREELQSVNEELITVNSELQNKIEQLSRSNDDLNNLLRSIEVATVFLDRNLKIKRFTPAATKIFNLIPADIDRPVAHLSSNLLYEKLDYDVKNVLKSLTVKSADIQANDGTWFHMRILPYRSAENIIEGVLVTFVDITEQKYIEEKLKKTNEHLNIIMENLPAIPFTFTNTPEIRINFIGKSCEKVTGFLPEQFMKKSSFWINRIHPDDKKKMLTSFTAIHKKGSLDLIFRWKCADGKYRRFVNYLRFAEAENGRPAYIVGVWQQINGSTLFNPKEKK